MPTLAMSYLRAKTTHQIPRPLKFPICLGPTMQLSRSACLDKPTPCPFKQRSHRQVIYSFQHVAQTNAHAERQLGSCSTTEHCSRIPTSHQRRALLAAGLGLVLAWPANSCRGPPGIFACPWMHPTACQCLLVPLLVSASTCASAEVRSLSSCLQLRRPVLPNSETNSKATAWSGRRPGSRPAKQAQMSCL